MCPVCLPRYSPSAFLHAYVAFLHPGAGLAVALLAATADAFESLAAGRQLLEAALNAEGVTQVPTPLPLHHRYNTFTIISPRETFKSCLLDC